MKTTSFIPFIFVLSPGNIGRLKSEINMEDGDQKTQSVNGQKIEYTYGSSGDLDSPLMLNNRYCQGVLK